MRKQKVVGTAWWGIVHSLIPNAANLQLEACHHGDEQYYRGYWSWKPRVFRYIQNRHIIIRDIPITYTDILCDHNDQTRGHRLHEEERGNTVHRSITSGCRHVGGLVYRRVSHSASEARRSRAYTVHCRLEELTKAVTARLREVRCARIKPQS